MQHQILVQADASNIPLALNDVAREFLDNNDRALQDDLLFNEVIKLGRQHGLEEVFSIGNNHSIAVDVIIATRGRDLLEGEKLESGLRSKELLRVGFVLGVAETLAGTLGKLGTVGHDGRETRRVAPQTRLRCLCGRVSYVTLPHTAVSASHSVLMIRSIFFLSLDVLRAATSTSHASAEYTQARRHNYNGSIARIYSDLGIPQHQEYATCRV